MDDTYSFGEGLVCGIDEVGRGPLAGPVVAAAVILGNGASSVQGLADSKRLTTVQRQRAFAAIVRHATAFGIGWSWPREIDRINIHNASLVAMVRAYSDLRCRSSRPDRTGALDFTNVQTIVDGRFCPDPDTHGLLPQCLAKIGGDGTVAEIMAASIIAKVTRDEWMKDFSKQDPRYGFERHKGYPTEAHRASIREHGPSVAHRMSFRLLP